MTTMMMWCTRRTDIEQYETDTDTDTDHHRNHIIVTISSEVLEYRCTKKNSKRIWFPHAVVSLLVVISVVCIQCVLLGFGKGALILIEMTGPYFGSLVSSIKNHLTNDF